MAAFFADDIFRCIFVNENSWILNKISLSICSVGFNWQYGSIDLDNGSALIGRQAIVWTIMIIGILYCRTYASLGLNELTNLVGG